MKTIMVTHTDLDGMGCVILRDLFNDKLGIDSIDSQDYGFEKDKEIMDYYKTFDKIIFTDISTPKETSEELDSLGIDVTYLDHHLSADWLKDRKGSVYSEDKCGTRLFWEYYIKPRIGRYNPIVDRFVELVNTYDCWEDESELWKDAVDLNYLMYSSEYRNWNSTDNLKSSERFNQHIEDKIRRDTSGEWRWDYDEREINSYQEGRFNETLRTSEKNMRIRKDSKDRIFGVFSSSSKISLVCSEILKKNPAMDYIICVNGYGGINGKLSFRTRRPDLDLNTFGMANGHAKAAAGTVSAEQAVKFLQDDSLVPRYKDEEGFSFDDTGTYFGRSTL